MDRYSFEDSTQNVSAERFTFSRSPSVTNLLVVLSPESPPVPREEGISLARLT